MRSWIRPVYALVGILAICSGNPAFAQTTSSNCDNSTAGDPIHCVLDGTAGNVNIDVSNVDIPSGMGTASETGIVGQTINILDLNDRGNVSIKVDGGTIDVTGDGKRGISGFIQTRGNLIIDVKDVDITTNGGNAMGIQAGHDNVGRFSVRVEGGSITTNSGVTSVGIGTRRESNAGDTIIYVKDVDITTAEATGIHAVKGQAGNGDVRITVIGGTITTEVDNASTPSTDTSASSTHGISGAIDTCTSLDFNTGACTAYSDARGNVNISVTNTEIVTNGVISHGIDAYSTSDDINISVRGGKIETRSTADISATTNFTFSHGIYAKHDRTSDIRINLSGGLELTTAGDYSYGVYAHADDDAQTSGRIGITADRASIRTAGGNAPGLVSRFDGSGSTTITARNATIETSGADAHGIYARGAASGGGRIAISTTGGMIRASGASASGIRVGAFDSNNMAVQVAGRNAAGYLDQTVTVNGEVHGGTGTSAAAVFLAGGGRVILGPNARLSADSGIAILATGDMTETIDGVDTTIKPKLRVDFRPEGRRIAPILGATDTDSGYWILNDGGETTVAVNNVVLHDGETGNTGRTVPNGAWDVTLRAEGVTVNRDTSPWTISAPAENVIADRDFAAADFTETKRPVYRIDEPVFGTQDEPGLLVEGNGDVFIGPQGSIGAESRIAIHATRGSPRLLVDMNLDGRQVTEVIGDDWILNDGGRTTLVVNEVKLHDGVTGVVPDAVAPNGAWDVTIRPEGVTVNRSTDPWTISDPAEGVISDRDFSTADFIETLTEPEDESEDESGTGGPIFMEEYAPRAALYEALPDILLRLHDREPARPRAASTWLRILGRTGDYEFKRSTVGAEYDADYFKAEAGRRLPPVGEVDFQASIHYVTGSVDVSSPVKGGDIDVRGMGVSFDSCWRCASDDWYASGRFSYTNYDIDLSSDARGRLRSDVDADGYSLHLEAGWRMTLGEAIQMTPRARLGYARVSVDSFTDAVDARVSYSDEGRSAASLGVKAETTRPVLGKEFLLWGSLDVEHRLGDMKTVARVSGEGLGAEPEENSVLVGLGSTWRWNDLVFHAGFSAREELDSGGEDYTGSLDLTLRF